MTMIPVELMHSGMQPEITALLNQEVTELNLSELKYRHERLEAIYNICLRGELKDRLKEAIRETQQEIRRTY